MRSWLRNNGLSLVITGLFLSMMWAQVLSGLHTYNQERLERHQPPMALGGYLKTGHFMEATAENWESEFLQMAAYVVLTAFLYQRGSSESKEPGRTEPVDRDPAASRRRRNVPWPVRRGGWALRVYSTSLSLAFMLLFLISIAMHAVGGTRAYNEEQLAQGGAPISISQYIGGAQFWFESFQNWQSEFLALLSMVVLSIFLRQRGSPESKPVDAPHSATGTGS